MKRNIFLLMLCLFGLIGAMAAQRKFLVVKF